MVRDVTITTLLLRRYSGSSRYKNYSFELTKVSKNSKFYEFQVWWITKMLNKKSIDYDSFGMRDRDRLILSLRRNCMLLFSFNCCKLKNRMFIVTEYAVKSRFGKHLSIWKDSQLKEDIQRIKNLINVFYFWKYPGW